MEKEYRSGEHLELGCTNRRRDVDIPVEHSEAGTENDSARHSEFVAPAPDPSSVASQGAAAIDLTQLLSSDVTQSGSFDLSGMIWTTSFGKLIQAMPLMTFLIDKSGNIVAANHACEKLGPDYEKVIRAAFSNLISDPTEAAEVKEAIWQVFSTRQQYVLNASVGIGSSKVWGRITFRSIRFAMERMIMALVEDLTVEREQLLLQRQHNRELTAEINRRRDIEKDLAASEEQYRQVVESATDSIYTTDHRGRFTYLNPVALNQTGYSKDELIGQPYLRLVHPDHAADVIKLYSMQWSERTPRTYCEFRIVAKNGATRWIGQNVQLLLKDDTAVGFQAIARDITDRKTAEERLRASLKEKEVLMREIHHRVKNNFQVISSLLILQADHVEEQKALDVLTSANTRLKAMALVHEKLYESGSLAQIRIDEYMADLVNDLICFNDDFVSKITLSLHVDEIYFGPDTAISLGLITTELLANAITHAFPEGRRGKVTVQLQSIDKDLFELRVSDNGVGISEEIRSGKTRSLGLELITAFAGKLHGEIHFDISRGTEFSMKFKQVDVRGWS